MTAPDARRAALADCASLVVKLGTNVLADARGRLDAGLINQVADQVHALKARGLRVAVVSSGAIGAGVGNLALDARPTALPRLQACAAVGQAYLMQAFNDALARHGRHGAQILLTRGDMEDRARYLNVRNCVHALQVYGVVPIINENDTVSVDEIRFGDNDLLAAMVTNLLSADLLVLLTTVDGLYRDAARTDRYDVVDDLETAAASVDGSRSALGTGGMASKLEAVANVLAAGEMAAIADGRRPDVLTDLLAGKPVGTLFLPTTGKVSARRRWIGLTRAPRGTLRVDAGAARAVTARKSLLAIGVTAVEGRFEAGDVVIVADPDGREIAQGMTNYPARDLARIKGLRTDQVAQVLGGCPYDEVIHADDLVLTGSGG